MLRYTVVAATMISASLCIAAERTVLFEELAIAGRPYCWQAEGANAFVGGHLSGCQAGARHLR